MCRLPLRGATDAAGREPRRDSASLALPWSRVKDRESPGFSSTSTWCKSSAPGRPPLGLYSCFRNALNINSSQTLRMPCADLPAPSASFRNAVNISTLFLILSLSSAVDIHHPAIRLCVFGGSPTEGCPRRCSRRVLHQYTTPIIPVCTSSNASASTRKTHTYIPGKTRLPSSSRPSHSSSTGPIPRSSKNTTCTRRPDRS